MAPRLQLHHSLKRFVPNVYFQPPTNVQMKYPCIIYKRDFADSKFADDNTYDYMNLSTQLRSSIKILIVKSQVKWRSMPMCLFNRHSIRSII